MNETARNYCICTYCENEPYWNNWIRTVLYRILCALCAILNCGCAILSCAVCCVLTRTSAVHRHFSHILSEHFVVCAVCVCCFFCTRITARKYWSVREKKRKEQSVGSSRKFTVLCSHQVHTKVTHNFQERMNAEKNEERDEFSSTEM